MALIQTEMGIIGNKGMAVAFERRFNHWMASAFDIKGKRGIDFGAGPSPLLRPLRQSLSHIQNSQGIGGLFEHTLMLQNEKRQRFKQRQFKRQSPIGGRGDLAFQLPQFGG